MIFMKPAFFALTVTIVITSLSACTLEDIEQQVTSIHYRVKSPVESVALSKWDVDSLCIKQKRAIRIKSIRPVKSSSTTYYRFTVYEETFTDTLTAESRLRKLFVKPPSLTGESRKLFPLRRAFRCDNKVFLLTTDAALFIDELNRLVEILKKTMG